LIFSLAAFAVVNSDHSGREKHQDKSGGDYADEAKFDYG